jgi:serine/threonine protein phosphatase PrpC
MRYSTTYDIGDRKLGSGINEDSIAVSVFEEGHRDGYQDRTRSGDDSRPPNRSAGVFVLADGAGGHDAGDIASYLATTIVAERLAPVAIEAARSRPDAFGVDIAPELVPARPDPDEIRSEIESAVTAAHRAILRHANESGARSYTTIVAGVYIDGQLHLGWVGDSRAYLINGVHDHIRQLTTDHAVVQELADAGEIDPIEAHVHPNGNEITRALGGSGHEDPETATVAVDTRSVRLFAEDTVLFTSDGLVDAQTDAPELYDAYLSSDRSEATAQRVRDAVVTDTDIQDVLHSADSLDDAASEYVSLANERGGKDNLSIVLFVDDTLPNTPESELPVRALDSDVDVTERETIIIREE